jgi:hypothetical protein
MADAKEPENSSPNVVSFGARKADKGAAKASAAAAATATVNTKPDGVRLPPEVDHQSVRTLNSVIEAVLKGECSGVCIMATGATGLQRFWVSFAKGSFPQIEATRYLGLTHLFQDVLISIVNDGIEIEGSPIE